MTLIAVAHAAAFLAIMHAQQVPAIDVAPFRLFTRPCLHVGLRPAYSLGDGFGATLQVTYCTWPL